MEGHFRMRILPHVLYGDYHRTIYNLSQILKPIENRRWVWTDGRLCTGFVFVMALSYWTIHVHLYLIIHGKHYIIQSKDVQLAMEMNGHLASGMMRKTKEVRRETVQKCDMISDWHGPELIRNKRANIYVKTKVGVGPNKSATMCIQNVYL